MSWKEFIVSLVDALAWPAALAIIAWLFRQQIGALIEGPVKRWKAGPVEVEYWETAAEVAEAVVHAELPEHVELDADLQHAAQLAEWIPVVAVGKAFGLVERRLREVAASDGGEAPQGMPPLALATSLQQRGLVTAETVHAIDGLLTLRAFALNDDGSGRVVSVKQAREDVTLVQGVLYALSRPPRRDD